MNNVLYEVLNNNPGLDPAGIVLINRAAPDEVSKVQNDHGCAESAMSTATSLKNGTFCAQG
jgi:hypothetical protein